MQSGDPARALLPQEEPASTRLPALYTACQPNTCSLDRPCYDGRVGRKTNQTLSEERDLYDVLSEAAKVDPAVEAKLRFLRAAAPEPEQLPLFSPVITHRV